jgi:hypothetical protein
MDTNDWVIKERRCEMTMTMERVQSAWESGDPRALSRVLEQLAAEGESRQTLELALETLLRQLREAGVDDETEELVNGVWDRLTGWCHASRQIASPTKNDESSGRLLPSIASSPSAPTPGR